MKSLAALIFAAALASAAEPAAIVSSPLAMDNEALSLTGSLSGRIMPRGGVVLPVTTTRPAGIVKEPAYRGTPRYGVIRLGNGPHASTWFVMDHAPADRRADNRLYIDRNHNGDLTDDGDGVMQSVGKNLPGPRVGPHFATVPASWGTAEKETATADYGMMFLFGADRSGTTHSMITRTAAVRAGSVALDGRDVRLALIETRGEGDFDLSSATTATTANFQDRSIKTMQLLVDVDGDGSFAATEVFDATLPIQVGAVVYRAGAAADGARVTLTPTDKPAQVVKVNARVASAKDNGLLAPGTAAPDFTAAHLDGRVMKLSDLRGKIVVLDFWATWCIPCIRSMPHVQKTIGKSPLAADIVWLGVCVWDDLASFRRWVPLNDARYAFTKVFDDAGKDKAAGIASKLYRVTGIPTIYVIDRDGRVVEGLTGYSGDDDHRLELALRKLGKRS